MNARRSALLFLPLFAACGLMLLPAPSTADKHLSARTVADILDGIIQPLFADDSGKVFGVERMIPIVKGHGIVLPHNNETPVVGEVWSPKSHIETQLKKIDSKHCRYFVGFFHMAHSPGKPVDVKPEELARNHVFLAQGETTLSPLATSNRERFPVLWAIRGPVRIGDEYRDHSPTDRKWLANEKKLIQRAERETRPLVQSWEKTAQKNLGMLHQGKSVETTQGAWTLFLRPIKASKASCVSCHTGAKQGDTLGVMVYAVSLDRLQK